MSAAPRWPAIWSALRIVAAALIAIAIVAQASRTIGGAISEGRDIATTTVNFFSFFTVLSNVSSVVVLAFAGIQGLARPREPQPYALSIAVACVSTYMVVTGIVYNLLLRGVALPQGTTVPWSNEVLHVVGPLFLGGYGGVAMYLVGIAVALGAVAALVVAVGRRRAPVEAVVAPA